MQPLPPNGPSGHDGMTDTLLSFVASYGVWVVFCSAYISCLAVPIPTAVVMLSAGAFAASGDLNIATVFAASLGGAILGDQTGFSLGRFGGTKILDRLARSKARRALLTRARILIQRWGDVGVFFSTWLFAPLGPWVNFVAGANRLSWLRFTIADVAGELIWVTVYVGLGYTFADRINQIASLLSSSVAFLMGSALTVILGWLLVRAVKAQRKSVPRG